MCVHSVCVKLLCVCTVLCTVCAMCVWVVQNVWMGVCMGVCTVSSGWVCALSVHSVSSEYVCAVILCVFTHILPELTGP